VGSRDSVQKIVKGSKEVGRGRGDCENVLDGTDNKQYARTVEESHEH